MQSRELRYVDPGHEFGDDEDRVGRVAKWRQPSSDFQRRVLQAARRKYWPDKKIRHEFIMIEKAMQPTSAQITPDWPKEWVYNCLEWFENKNKRGYVPLHGLLVFLNDEDRKDDYIRRLKASGVLGASLQSDYNPEDDPYG